MKFQLIIDENCEEQITAYVKKPSDLTDRLEALIAQYNGADRLVAYEDDRMVIVGFSQIECICVMQGKTYAINENGKQYLLKQRLYELEALLPGSFIRINKSSIANLDRVTGFTATYAGGINATFRSGFSEYVSRRCFTKIKRRLEK